MPWAYRWFPEGQIVFLAPTKPLVTQQVTACHEAAGIPASATAQLLGNVKPSLRAELWNTKRFVTDIHTTSVCDEGLGSCSVTASVGCR